MLGERYGKLINNGDNGIVNNKLQKYIKQLQDITDEGGLKRAYETKMVYINTILNYS